MYGGGVNIRIFSHHGVHHEYQHDFNNYKYVISFWSLSLYYEGRLWECSSSSTATVCLETKSMYLCKYVLSNFWIFGWYNACIEYEKCEHKYVSYVYVW